MTPEEYLTRGLRTLASYKLQFERGEKGALLEAIYYCALYRFPLPTWAMEAFEAAEGRASGGEIGSWDEVFGKPWGDGRRKARWMKSRSNQIWFDVRALRGRGLGIEAAFAKVAATKHMTVPTVRRFYYNVDRVYKKVFSQMRSDFEKR